MSTWNAARIAARASSLHWPLVRNMVVRSEETVFQTVGHLFPPSRVIREENPCLTDENEGISKA
jgi:hypothetical protein